MGEPPAGSTLCIYTIPHFGVYVNCPAEQRGSFIARYRTGRGHDNRMSKQFVNDAVSVTVFATRWHEVPLPPLEGEVVER